MFSSISDEITSVSVQSHMISDTLIFDWSDTGRDTAESEIDQFN